MGYHKELDEYTRFELIQEMARREKVLHAGICDYCNRDGAETACRFPDRHQVARDQSLRLAEQAERDRQRLIKSALPLNHPDFNVRGTQTGRAPSVNFVPEPECDETDGGRFQQTSCGKTGCPNLAHHRVQGGLLYHACDDHLTEIQRLVHTE